MSSRQNKLQAIVEGKTTYIGKPCVQGHNGTRYVRNNDCVECRKVIKAKARKNPEWYIKNKEKILARQKKWRLTEAGKTLERAKRAKRRAQQKQKTPKWANPAAIKVLYKEAIRKTLETGVIHHVDHIIPLRGKNVSGLHVEYNLQVIPAHENIKKSNKY